MLRGCVSGAARGCRLRSGAGRVAAVSPAMQAVGVRGTTHTLVLKLTKIAGLSDAVEAVQERGAARALRARGFSASTEHGHAPADCLEKVWNDCALSAMVVDLLLTNLRANGAHETTEDRFAVWAISGLVDAAREIGLEI